MKIKFGTIPDGKNAGFLATHIEFEVKDKLTPEIVTDLIIDLKKNALTRNVYLYGIFPDNMRMFSFTSVLIENNFMLQAKVDGKERFPWIDHLHYLVVELESPKWAPFNCNEIRINFLEEPMETNSKIIPLRYIIQGSFEKKDIFNFVKEAKNPWNILLENEGVYNE